MIAIQIADFFILKKAESKRAFEWKTLPDMVVTIVIYVIAEKLAGEKK